MRAWSGSRVAPDSRASAMACSATARPRSYCPVITSPPAMAARTLARSACSPGTVPSAASLRSHAARAAAGSPAAHSASPSSSSSRARSSPAWNRHQALAEQLRRRRWLPRPPCHLGLATHQVVGRQPAEPLRVVDPAPEHLPCHGQLATRLGKRVHAPGVVGRGHDHRGARRRTRPPPRGGGPAGRGRQATRPGARAGALARRPGGRRSARCATSRGRRSPGGSRDGSRSVRPPRRAAHARVRRRRVVATSPPVLSMAFSRTSCGMDSPSTAATCRANRASSGSSSTGPSSA